MKYKLKNIFIFFILLITTFNIFQVYVKRHALYDDELMINVIQNDERVDYEYIVLEDNVVFYTLWKQILDESEYRGYKWTWFVRGFTAWQYPLDEVEPNENYKIICWVDMNQKVIIVARLHGSRGLV